MIQNPTKMAEKVTFVTTKDPMHRAAKKYKKKKKTATTTPTPPSPPTTTTKITTNGTEIDQTLEDYKSNLSS